MHAMIPNQFHFIYGLKKQKQPFALYHYLCLESCRRINRPERIYFHYHNKPFGHYWDLIKDYLSFVKVHPTSVVSRFRYGWRNRACLPYAYAHHSDFIRLERLLEYGGVYADIDTIFVSKIPERLFAKSFVLGWEDDIVCQRTGEKKRSLCNAFILSEKGAAFGSIWLAEMNRRFDGSWSAHSTLLPQELSERYPKLIHIEPSRTFYPYMWTPQDLHTLLQGCDTDLEGIVSIHLWSHLWESKRRTDFSDFHAGMLTEDYIRNVDTTYNLLARPFLPVLTKRLPVSVLKRTHADRKQGNRAVKRAGSISVIIPTFNRPHLLRQAVDSVLAQNRPAKEIIIVDDGSEPAYRTALEGLSDLDCRIRLYYLPQNRGTGAARNAGLALAKGDYIVFLDDDDLLGENQLASSATRLDHCSDADIGVSRSCLFDTDPISIHQEVPASLISFKEMETHPVEQIFFHGLVIGSCMIRRSILNGVCFNEVLTFGEDLLFWLHLACQGCRFQGNPEAVTYVRRHSNDENARCDIYWNIVECYTLLLDSPLLRSRGTRFVAHGRLALNLTRLGRATAFRHIAFLLTCPDLIPRYLLKYLAIRFKIRRNNRILRRCGGPASAWSGWTT
jgi:glycosyltransferase involved in cell wall biosynthesis